MSSILETIQKRNNNVNNGLVLNSPILYGLERFGLEITLKVLAGSYMFFYINELGLAVAIVAIINIVDAISEAANDLLVVYSYERTKK